MIDFPAAQNESHEARLLFPYFDITSSRPKLGLGCQSNAYSGRHLFPCLLVPPASFRQGASGQLLEVPFHPDRAWFASLSGGISDTTGVDAGFKSGFQLLEIERLAIGLRLIVSSRELKDDRTWGYDREGRPEQPLPHWDHWEGV